MVEIFSHLELGELSHLFQNSVSEERALKKFPIWDKSAIIMQYSFIDLFIKNHRNKLMK